MHALALVRDDERQRRNVTINIRAPRQTKELIDTAAKVTGQTRSEFVLESARQRAKDVLLDQRLFVLDHKDYDKFLELLDTPPPPSNELKKLLATKSPWEK